MTSSQASTEAVGSRRAAARIDDIRRLLSTTTDQSARSRLHVRLADLLSATGDPRSAVGELGQAAAEGLVSAGLLFGVRVVGSRLPAAEIDALTTLIKARRAVHASRGTRSRPLVTATLASTSRGPDPVIPPMIPPMAALPPLPREMPKDTDPVEAAFAALAEGKPVRARVLAEEGARAGGAGSVTKVRMGRLRALVVALDHARATRESLRLARTLAEVDGDRDASMGNRDALRSIVEGATRDGAPDLASRWWADLGQPMPRPRTRDPGMQETATASPSLRFRHAQRAALMAVPEGRNDDRSDRKSDEKGDNRAETERVRLAFDAEPSPLRRQTLALRWADILRNAGDGVGALAVLGRAIEELPAARSSQLRRVRADLLRAERLDEELCQAIESDVQVATAQERRDLRAEQARLLDRLGRFDAALDVRLVALDDTPDDLGQLALARQRLEGMGRLDLSFDLAQAALSHVKDRLARAGLLRDVATLAEALGGDRPRAALAWLDVLSLVPNDEVALEAAERLLRQTADHDRLGALLAWGSAREGEPTRRAAMLWRLAEFRRTERQAPLLALALYREIVASGVENKISPPFPAEDWQRRDDLLAVHTARALAAPTSAETARAISDRADLLTIAGRLDDADRDLGRALDLDPGNTHVIDALEHLFERRGDLRGLRQRLLARVEGATDAAASRLWLGIGRANEALGDPAAATSAYERAITADIAFRPPLTRLRQLAISRGDFAEAARLFEKEITLTSVAVERAKLSVELGVLLAGKLNAAARAVEVLDAILALEPQSPDALDAMFGAALAAGAWERATQALEAMLSAGPAPVDTPERYHRLGLAAEKAGQLDRALSLYSRSYARNPAFRPTLERLSEVCFERQQWENAWKATEHLMERHGADLDRETRAELALRSALADLHAAQRVVATSRIAAMVVGPSSPGGLRDVAESWASMRFDPRLLAGIDGDRRSRVLVRLAEVLALTSRNTSHPSRALARETQAALAMADQRWADALSALDVLGGDAALDTRRRCLFLVSAGDILLHRQGDPVGAALRYRRAGALNPREPRLARAGTAQIATNDPGVAARTDPSVAGPGRAPPPDPLRADPIGSGSGTGGGKRR